jgi:hypothetical protein
MLLHKMLFAVLITVKLPGKATAAATLAPAADSSLNVKLAPAADSSLKGMEDLFKEHEAKNFAKADALMEQGKELLRRVAALTAGKETQAEASLAGAVSGVATLKKTADKTDGKTADKAVGKDADKTASETAGAEDAEKSALKAENAALKAQLDGEPPADKGEQAGVATNVSLAARLIPEKIPAPRDEKLEGNITNLMTSNPKEMNEDPPPAVGELCDKCKIENLCAGQLNAQPGTPTCLPDVCNTVCMCRYGLPEPIPPPPYQIAILPPPLPVWTRDETKTFCSCVSTGSASCTTPLCSDAIQQVTDRMQCYALFPDQTGHLPYPEDGQWPPEPPVPKPSANPVGETWLLSNEGESCTARCQRAGSFCSTKRLREVGTAAGIQAAATAAGKTCKKTIGWAYNSNPGICTNSKCCGDGTCKDWCAYGRSGRITVTCDTVSAHYSRLCACDAKPTPTAGRS